MLHGADYTLPTKVLVHGFLTVNGEKMSKTRGTFITARTYLDHLDPQYLRYYYAAKFNGRIDDLDLNLEEFVHRVDAELVNKIANLVSRVVPFVNRYFEGRLGRLDASVRPLVSDIQARLPRVRESYERLEFNRAVQEIVAIAEVGNKCFQDAAPWELVKHDPQAAQAVCTFAANCCRTVAALIKPVLPQYAADVEAILQVEPVSFEESAAFELEDHGIGAFKRLVERVDARQVSAMVGASKEDLDAVPASPAATPVEALEPEIDIDAFGQVDLRVATVLQAETVDGADRLLRLKVDIGNEQRTIFAGIRRVLRPRRPAGQTSHRGGQPQAP